jgi:heat-inducible transcriptional repressor
MLNERRRHILAALVAEYIASAHPVSSRTLVERYGLTCSSATVRNDLAALEDDGLVYQPHISAGRIPTDGGYRTYVDTEVAPRASAADSAESEAVRTRLASSEGDAAGVVREAASLLSALTGYASFVVAPPARRSRLRRLTVVPMSSVEVLLVVVTDLGQVLKRPLEFAAPVDPAVLVDAEALLADAINDALPEEAEHIRRELLRDPTSVRWLAAEMLAASITTIVQSEEHHVAHGGLATLLRQPEFSDPRSAGPVVDLLEDAHGTVAALAGLAGPGETVVRIGRENTADGFHSMSIVATTYGPGAESGVACVIGPTRMEYRRAVAVTACVADSLEDAL